MLVCFLTTILLFLEKQRGTYKHNTPVNWLITWSLSATLLYVGHFIYFYHQTNLIPISDTIYVAMNLCVYPLYLVYISELTDEKPLTSSKILMFLLLGPSVLAGVTSGILYIAMNSQETNDFIENFLYKNEDYTLGVIQQAQIMLHIVCRILFAIQVFVVAIVGIYKVRKYNNIVYSLYADTEDKEAFGLTTLLILLMVISVFSATVNIIGRYFFVDSLLLSIPSMAFTVLLFSIGWVGAHQKFSFRDIVMQHPNEVPAINIAENNQLCQQFEQIVVERKLFLENDLRLDRVVRLLGTNRTYLLKALSDNKHMTFKEYINRLRIGYAEKLMEENPNLSKTDIATLSGYNTTSSFYRNYNLYQKKNLL